MSKTASGSQLYFEVLRSMGPSSRLQNAIKAAEKQSHVSLKQREAAAKRAARAVRRSQGASKTAARKAKAKSA